MLLEEIQILVFPNVVCSDSSTLLVSPSPYLFDKPVSRVMDDPPLKRDLRKERFVQGRYPVQGVFHGSFAHDCRDWWGRVRAQNLAHSCKHTVLYVTRGKAVRRKRALC